MVDGLDEGPKWRAAREGGVDMAQLEYLMSLSVEERLLRHDRALQTVRALRRAGREYYGFDPRLD